MPGLKLSCTPRRNGATTEPARWKRLQGRHRHRRHHHRHHAVHGRPHQAPCCRRWRRGATVAMPWSAACRPARSCADAHGPVRHERQAERRDGAAEALRGIEARPGEQKRRQADGDAARLPKILRFIPGTAQDVRAYFLTLQYWLAGSDENVANMVRFWSTATPTARAKTCAARSRPICPVDYPEVGVYHPGSAKGVTDTGCRPAERAQGARHGRGSW
jgi:hypothetical protein